MGKLLPNGINYNELEKQYINFVNEPFPDPPVDDDLDDLYCQLVEYDSYISGIISYILAGKVIPYHVNVVDSELESSIKEHENHSELKPLLDYKEKIDNITTIAFPYFKK